MSKLNEFGRSGRLRMIFLAVVGLSLTVASCNMSNFSDEKNTTNPAPYSDGTMQLAGTSINIELARTVEEKSQGLSGRESIGEDEGMLFIFDTKHQPAFWMKDMKFPIDIVWIDGNKVVEIASEVPPEPGTRNDYDLKRYMSQSNVDQVLELKAGWASRHNLKAGDEIELKLNQ